MNMKAYCHDLTMLLGRMMISMVFIVAGVTKLMHYDLLQAAMVSQSMQYASAFLITLIVLQMLGGAMIFVGYRARFAAMVLLVFMIMITMVYHDFWMLQGDPMTSQLNYILKNVSMMGGLLYVMANGSGRFSISGS